MSTLTIELSNETIPVGAQWPDVVPIWVPAFFGDSNRRLKEVQRDSYSSLAFALYDSTKHRYLDACDLLGVETGLAERLADIVIPDLPYLPRVYRKVAAWYRYSVDREPVEDADDIERLRVAWEEFFRAEAAAVTADDAVARAVLDAAANPGLAASAEELVVQALRRRYGELTLPRRVVMQRQGTPPGVRSEVDAQVRPNPPD